MKKCIVVPALAVMFVVCLYAGASASPPSVLSDADVVPYKHWEIWLSFNYSDSKEQNDFQVPTLEIIYGIMPRVELSLEGTYIIENENNKTTSGLDSLSLQPKILVLEEKGAVPAVATGFTLEVPTEEDRERFDWRGRVWATFINVQKNFGDLQVYTQAKYYIDKKWRYGADAYYGLNDRLKLMGEVYAISYIASDAKDELNFRAGAKYEILDHVKVFFAAGRSLLPARANRPSFEANWGVMTEF